MIFWYAILLLLFDPVVTGKASALAVYTVGVIICVNRNVATSATLRVPLRGTPRVHVGRAGSAGTVPRDLFVIRKMNAGPTVALTINLGVLPAVLDVNVSESAAGLG